LNFENLRPQEAISQTWWHNDFAGKFPKQVAPGRRKSCNGTGDRPAAIAV